MRIIAGTARGVRLKTVPGYQVRPTTDRVKESLFQIIGPFFDGGWVLDLFAGSGALGLEALSRGAEYAVFVDKSRASMNVIRANLRAAGLESRAEVYLRDARAALKTLIRRGIQFRLIFLDPPYRDKLLPVILQRIGETDLLEESGILVAEHASDRPLQGTFGNLQVFRSMSYGDTCIDLYRRMA